MVKSFSPQCKGGLLRYWPSDDGQRSKALVKKERFEDLDVSRFAYLLDGNRGHEVRPFKSERHSLVSFTRKGVLGPKPPSRNQKKALARLGFVLPTPESMNALFRRGGCCGLCLLIIFALSERHCS